ILPDRRGVLPDTLRVFHEPGENIILTLSPRTTYRGRIVHIDPLDLQATFRYLYKDCHIGTVLIEGGRRLFTSLFEAGMWDELIVIQNREYAMKSGIQAPVFPRIASDHQVLLGSDT